MLIVATVIWGGTFAATRGGLAYISPELLIAIRFCASFLVLAPVVTLLGVKWWRSVGSGIVLGLFLAAGYLLQTAGLQYTTAGRSAFITYLFAVFIPPLQRIISRRRLSAGNLIGLIIVIAGTAILTRPWQTAGWNRGDMLTLASAVAFAFFIVFVDRFSQKRDPVTFVPTQFFVAGVVALGVGLMRREIWLTAHPALWITIIYLTLFGTIGALGIQTVFQIRTTPVRATTIYALEPVFAGAIGVVVLGEKMIATEIIGALVIVAGVLVSEFWKALVESRSSDPQK